MSNSVVTSQLYTLRNLTIIQLAFACVCMRVYVFACVHACTCVYVWILASVTLNLQIFDFGRKVMQLFASRFPMNVFTGLLFTPDFVRMLV